MNRFFIVNFALSSCMKSKPKINVNELIKHYNISQKNLILIYIFHY